MIEHNNLVNFGSKQTSNNQGYSETQFRYQSRQEAFATLAPILILSPHRICLTAFSTFLPLDVTGISGQASMMPGTCRGLSSLRMTARMRVARSETSDDLPGAHLTKSTTVSSVSIPSRLRP